MAEEAYGSLLYNESVDLLNHHLELHSSGHGEL